VVAYTQLGVVQTKRKEFTAARRALESELRLALQRKSFHTSLGLLAVEEGQLDLAVTHFRRGSEVDPASLRARSNLGLALGRSGDSAGARQELEDQQQLDSARVRRLRTELGL
jgi:Tfp pilus assembly protein PilF